MTKLLLTALLLTGSLHASDSICSYEPDCFFSVDTRRSHESECFLNDAQRQRIWDEIHFCVKKMNICLDNADREAARISDIHIERTTRAAIAGAISGLATRNVYGVVISTCLNTLGSIAGDSYSHFVASKRYVKDAQYYAFRADELQELLWRG